MPTALAGLQTRAGGGPRGRRPGGSTQPRARPEGSSRCPYNSPGSCPADSGLVGQPLRPGGVPGTGSWEEAGLLGLAPGPVPPRSTSGPASPKSFPNCEAPPEAPPGRLPRLCATHATRSFPANSRLFPGSPQLVTLGVPWPRAACSCAQVSEPPETPLPSPAPPPAGPTQNPGLKPPHPPDPHPPPPPPGRIRSHPEHTGAGGAVQEPRGEATEPGGRRSRRKSRATAGARETRAPSGAEPPWPSPSRGGPAPGWGAARARPRDPPRLSPGVVLLRLLPGFRSPGRGGPRGEGGPGRDSPSAPDVRPRCASSGLRLALLPAFLPSSSPAPPGLLL